MTAATHWTLSDFIRGYKIRAECTPMARSPFAHDVEGLYHHKCTLFMGGHEHRRLVVPYTTTDPDSIRFVTQINEKTGQQEQVWKSRLSTREILYSLGCEAALYEIAKRPITGVQLDTVSKKAAKTARDSKVVLYDRDCWATIVFQDDTPLPPPDELARLYLNTERMVKNLRVFLGGRANDAHTPAYRVLISRVDEIAVFVYNWTMGKTCG